MFTRDGFLSPDHLHYARKVHSGNCSYLTIARRLNRLALTIVKNCHVVDGLRSVLLASLLLRSTGVFQGAILTAGRGMKPEAMVLLRTLFELWIRTEWINSDRSDERMELILAHEAYERRRMLKRCIESSPSIAERARLEDEMKRELDALSQLSIEPRRMSVRDCAKQIGKAWDYDFVYSQLCDATHVSLRHLQDFHLDIDEETGQLKNMRLQPSDDMGEVLHQLCDKMGAILKIVNDEFGLGHGDELSTIYSRLAHALESHSGNSREGQDAED